MSNLAHENVLKALETIFNRPQPHLDRTQRLKLVSGLVNSFPRNYHEAIEDVLVAFRIVNKTSNKSEYQIRQDIRGMMRDGLNRPNTLSSVFFVFKEAKMDVTGAEKHTILSLQPENSPLDDWREINFLATSVRCTFNRSTCGSCEECSWYEVLKEIETPAIPKSYQKDHTIEDVMFDWYFVTAGDTEYYPNNPKTFSESDAVFICENIETAKLVHSNTDETPTIFSLNGFTTALLVAQFVVAMKNIKYIGLVNNKTNYPSLINIQNMAREGAKIYNADCKIAIVDWE